MSTARAETIRALRGVADLTAASGALLLLRPCLALGELTPDPSPLARHLFGTIGVFMTISGGSLRNTLRAPTPDRGQLLWAGLQKLGAVSAVMLAVRRGLFARRGLLVASFDLVAGLACLSCTRQAVDRVSAAG